jgi:hypothetical protein
MAIIEPEMQLGHFLTSLPERERILKAKIAVADYVAVMCRNCQRSSLDWEYLEQLLKTAYGD